LTIKQEARRWIRVQCVDKKRLLELSHAELSAPKLASLHQHGLNIAWQALAVWLQHIAAGLVF
jgi:hypothetical protein